MQQKQIKTIVHYMLATVVVIVLAVPIFVFAEETQKFVSIAGIPGLQGAGQKDFSMEEYLKNIYRIAIIAAALIAVVKLILAGAQYVLSGVITDKEQAKKDIWSALVGLLIILAAVTILTQINPSLTNLEALKSVPGSSYEHAFSLPKSAAQQATDYCYSLRSSGDSCVVLTCADINNSYSTTKGCRSYCLEQLDGKWEGRKINGTCYASKFLVEGDTGKTETIVCGTESTLTCEEATKQCMSNPNYHSVQQTNPNTLVCFLKGKSFSGNETWVDPTQQYIIYTNGVSNGRTGTITNIYEDQSVDLIDDDGQEYRNFPCTDLSPNPPGCIQPDSRKLQIQDDVIYYAEIDTTVGIAKPQITIIDNYQTLDGYVQVLFPNNEKTLLPCSKITPKVCQ